MIHVSTRVSIIQGTIFIILYAITATEKKNSKKQVDYTIFKMVLFTDETKIHPVYFNVSESSIW